MTSLTLTHDGNVQVDPDVYTPRPTLRWKPRPHTSRIIIHDSHTDQDVENVEDYLRATGQKMGLLDIGYHFLVPRDGVVIEARPHDVFGSHAPGHNMDSIGVCLFGGKGPHGPEDNFTHAQRMGLMNLFVWLGQQYWDGSDSHVLKIVGHTEVQHFVDSEHICPALDMDMLRDDFKFFKAHGVLP